MRNGEQIYFSVSQDGLHWTDLGNGPAVISDIGEKGVRDPFLIRNCLDDRFYLLATDLRIASQKGWDKAQYAGSCGIIIWSSDNLIDWRRPEKAVFPFIQELHGGCVWAPEAVFSEEKMAYMVYWASMVERKQRIYAAFTRDFHDFTDFSQIIERQNHIIDTTYAEENGYFYRFSAEEAMGGITGEYGSSLCGTDYECMSEGPLPGMGSMEGPIIFYMREKKKWCLYADDIGKGAGYIPFIADTLAEGRFTRLSEQDFDMGKRRKRHGSILEITDGEYERLIQYYGIYG